VPHSLTGVTRRAFLKASIAGLSIPPTAFAQSTGRETLYNGIELARPWPPVRRELSAIPQRPPYLASPPAVINIDVGRQLFVDDFLIEESSLHRTFHQAEYHAVNPVLTPVRTWERRDPYSVMTGTPPSPSAMVFSDGVFFDPADKLFKMWYMAGYQQHTALALSHDGVNWERPVLDVVPGTNIVSAEGRDSNTVWLDLEAGAPAERFKMAGFNYDAKTLKLWTSRDGIHWRFAGTTGPTHDRSTFFRNPFRGVWVFSLRAGQAENLKRYRRYLETREFSSAQWRESEPVAWVGADSRDVVRDDLKTTPEIYNLDAVAYESVMLGLFTMYRGENTEREKPNDICVGFSRDGFHWSRESRSPFIPVSERQGSWNWGNVQSAGGGCLVVGDRLHFYVSGRQGVPGTGMPGECSTGLAILRRDGFASLTDTWPPGLARPVSRLRSQLTTRPIRFSGGHVFVNAVVDGDLRVEVLDAGGRVIEPFSLERSVPVSGDGCRLEISWRGAPPVSALAGQVVRFRFSLNRARLYAFWVSPSPAGASRGYVAGGGPGFTRSTDAG
jgi:hypothetical protein